MKIRYNSVCNSHLTEDDKKTQEEWKMEDVVFFFALIKYFGGVTWLGKDSRFEHGVGGFFFFFIEWWFTMA